MATFTQKPVGWFKSEKQVREVKDDPELLALGKSLLVRQLQPVIARTNGKLDVGHRRLAAAILVSKPTLDVIITDEIPSDSQVRLMQLAENLQRAGLTDSESYLAVKDVATLNPTWLKKDLAEHLHVDASMMTRILVVDDLIPAAREAFLNGAFGFSKAYAISKAKPEIEQQQLLAAILSGASRDAIEQAGRKTRNVGKQAVRVARIKCPMSRAVVQISGADISLDEAIEAAQEWVKEAKKASEQGLCAKTFERLCRDKAKKEKRQ